MCFRHCRLYGERGLAGQQGVAWLFGEVLPLTFADALLSQYQATYDPDGWGIRAVSGWRLFPNAHPSPQPYLPGLEGERPLAVQLPLSAPRQRTIRLRAGPATVKGKLFARYQRPRLAYDV